MDDRQFKFQSDRAISKVEHDLLDRGAFVRSLVRPLVDNGGKSGTGLTLGLVGRWGEGKSSILHLLKEEISGRYPDAVIVQFSPWLVSQRKDLVRSFFDELGNAVQAKHAHKVHPGRTSQLSQEIGDALADYVDRLSPVFEVVHPGAGASAKGATSLYRSLASIYRNKNSASQEMGAVKQRVELLLADLPAPVIVFVDEVDRIEDQDIRDLMHLVRAVADFPTMSYVLAYDERRVAEALGFEAPDDERLDRGRKYLEKIVQIQVPLPITFSAELKTILDRDIDSIVPQELRRGRSVARYLELRDLIVPALLPTARDVKRLAATFAHRFELIEYEVDWVGTLGFAVLGIAAPDVAEQVRTSPERFVFGGVRSAGHTPGQIKNPLVSKLISFLFPALGNERAAADCDRHEIAFERPLTTLLRLKVLPAAVSRRDVRRITELEREAGRVELTRIANEGRLLAFAQRLRDLQEDQSQALSDQGKDVWVNLMAVHEKRAGSGISFWIRSLNDGHEIAGLFLSLVQKRRVKADDLGAVVSGLVSATSFHFAATLLMEILDREDMPKIESTDLARSITRVVVAAKRHCLVVPTRWLPLAVIYLARDAGLWSERERSVMGARLLDARNLDRFLVEGYGQNRDLDRTLVSECIMPLEHFDSAVRMGHLRRTVQGADHELASPIFERALRQAEGKQK